MDLLDSFDLIFFIGMFLAFSLILAGVYFMDHNTFTPKVLDYERLRRIKKKNSKKTRDGISTHIHGNPRHPMCVSHCFMFDKCLSGQRTKR
jgi:hypothetical protein